MPFANACLDSLGICPDRIRAFSVCQHSVDELKITLINPIDGLPFDLTQWGITDPADTNVPTLPSSSSASIEEITDGAPNHGVQIIVKEDYNSIGHMSKFAVVKTAADAENGIVYLEVDPILTKKAGVFLGQAIIWDKGIARKQYPFYLEVTPRLDIFSCSGPITMSEVRMAVRDMCPEMNFLIDTVEFKDHEIAWAIRRPIDYWNEVPPPVALFTTKDFPFRYHWMEAVIAQMLRIVAVWMRRNDLDYTAGGLQVGDTKKWPDYIKMADDREKNWKEFVHNKKIEINLKGAYAFLGGYRSAPYR